jgi:hypothetical protein
MKSAVVVVAIALAVIVARFAIPPMWKAYCRWRFNRFRRTLYVPERWEHTDRERSA